MKTFILIVLFFYPVLAEEIIIKNEAGIDAKFGETGNEIKIVSSKRPSSVIVWPGGNEFCLPNNFWISDAVYDEKKMILVTLIKTSKKDSPGLWSYGCLDIRYVDNRYTVHISMINYHNVKNGTRKWLYGIADISGYPAVNFTVASSSMEGGKVARGKETWNILTEEMVK